ncbi:MAG: DNA repair protein RecN [Sphaerochaeta sp.]
MLESLDIHAFALIEDIHIDFSEGFTVITGETGAGKSILLSALSLLLGGTGDVSTIRSGFNSASVSGCFSFDRQNKEITNLLEELSIEVDDDVIIIRRILKNNGRTLSYLNDQPINKSSLSRLSTMLLDISAQHAHQSLMKSEKQLSLVDGFGECEIQLEKYQEIYHQLSKMERERDDIVKLLASSKREEDYLKFASEELNRVNPKEGEDEELQEEVHKLSKFEEIHDSLANTVDILNGSYEGLSTINNINNSIESLNKASKVDIKIKEYQDRLKSAALECEDIYESLKDYLDEMTFSQSDLDNMQQRLSQLQRIKKKYGPTLENVITFKEEIDEKISALNNGSDDIEYIDNQIKKTKAKLLQVCEALTQKRERGALKLSKAIERSLRGLGMPHASFSIELTPYSDYRISGKQAAVFMLSANPGLEMRPIKEIASGGELSRVMLAIKSTLREKDSVSTLVFDEVDAGIGGEVASKVADELISLSTSSQVIAITHLASIAAKADYQLVVKKYVKKNMSFTSIDEVKDDERVKEVARMLSGDSESTISLKHASSLLDA